MGVKKGDTVSVHYTGTFEDGREFDTTGGRDPFCFQVGSGQVIQGFDEAVLGMETGEKKTVSIPADKAYGERDENMVHEIPKADLGGAAVSEGDIVEMRSREGEVIPATIGKVTDDAVVIDFNHPLAGRTLNFELELIELSCA